jgi:hypothetical protein
MYENDTYDAMDNAFLVPVMPVTNKNILQCIGLDLRTRRASRIRQSHLRNSTVAGQLAHSREE